MAYTKTNWSNGEAPAINGKNLNKMEQGIYDATYENGVNVGTSIDSNYKINILYSANLFDESTYTNGMAWNNATGFPSRATAYFNITAGKTYSISASNISRLNGGGVNVFEKSQPSASTSISSVVSFNTDGSFTFTASSGATILAIQLSIPSGNISFSNYPDIMIVEGSTPKPYTKYVSQPTINVDGQGIYVKGQNEVYSINEQRIGTWIDGKPLYRKVMTITVPTVTTPGTAVTNKKSIGSNIDTAYVKFGYVVFLNGRWTLPVLGDTYFTQTFVNDAKELNCRSTFNSLNGSTAYVIIEYTKTTDTTQQTRSISNNEVEEDKK